MIPLSKEGEEIIPGQEPPLAPGVRGYALQAEDGSIIIGSIAAEEERNGAVSRFLDGLETGYRYKIPNVLSWRLGGMLFRRGWGLFLEEHEGETVPTFVKDLRGFTS